MVYNKRFNILLKHHLINHLMASLNLDVYLNNLSKKEYSIHPIMNTITKEMMPKKNENTMKIKYLSLKRGIILVSDNSLETFF